MSKRLLDLILAGLLLSVAAARLDAQVAPKAPVDPRQAQINSAIDRGVKYLQTHPWDHPTYRTGYVALAGLTLLECGVKADDPLLKGGAVYIRAAAPQITGTYEIALSILFLDRLGQPEDRPAIQALALRLLAGQTGNGGWGYQCPALPPADLAALYKFLESNRPPAIQKLHESRRPDPTAPLANPISASSSKTADPFRKFSDLLTTRPAKKNITDTAKPGPMKLAALPAHLRLIPVVVLQGQSRPQFLVTRDDNSNTQFALLALWVGRRHEVPTEQALLLAQLRFQASQRPDGHWTYMPAGEKTTPAMTAVGLLGYAMGYGVSNDLAPNARPKTALQEPAVTHGLTYLGQFVDAPGATAPPLYYLWSLERVAVLYDQKLIGGKDWYGWGAPLLVAGQNADGSWQGGHYHGSSLHVDTCLALLFLKRANLARDLTQQFRLAEPIRESASEISPTKGP